VRGRAAIAGETWTSIPGDDGQRALGVIRITMWLPLSETKDVAAGIDRSPPGSGPFGALVAAMESGKEGFDPARLVMICPEGARAKDPSQHIPRTVNNAHRLPHPKPMDKQR